MEIGIDWEFGIDLYTLLYLKQASKDLLYSGRELCLVFYNNLHGKRIWKRIDTCICITESLCYKPKNNKHRSSTVLQYKIKIRKKDYLHKFSHHLPQSHESESPRNFFLNSCIEMQLIHKDMHIFDVYNLMSLDINKHLWYHHHKR